MYGFSPEFRVNPFVGAGVNYTWTFDEREFGPLSVTEVKLRNSWGLGAQVGLAFKFNPAWELIVDAHWIDIDIDADVEVRVNSARVGSAEVDPVVFGLHLGYKF